MSPMSSSLVNLYACCDFLNIIYVCPSSSRAGQMTSRCVSCVGCTQQPTACTVRTARAPRAIPTRTAILDSGQWPAGAEMRPRSQNGSSLFPRPHLRGRATFQGRGRLLPLRGVQRLRRGSGGELRGSAPDGWAAAGPAEFQPLRRGRQEDPHAGGKGAVAAFGTQTKEEALSQLAILWMKFQSWLVWCFAVTTLVC